MTVVQVTCVLFNGHKTYTAGVGSAMAYVIGQDMWLDPLTTNHVPSNPDEEARIVANGGAIKRAALAVKCCGMGCRQLNFTGDMVVTPGGPWLLKRYFCL